MTTDKSAAPERLLPCPHCGSNDIEREGWVGMDVHHKKISGPACDGCGASAESVSAWNRRVLIDTPAPPTPAEPAENKLRDALVDGIAQTIDHPSVYAGGPSYNSLRIAEAIVREYGTNLAAAPQPAPDRETLVEVIRRANDDWIANQSKPTSRPDAIADYLLARGLCLPTAKGEVK